MQKHYQILDWDSNFFGYPVARISEPELSDAELQNVLEWLRTLHIELVYYPAKNKLENNFLLNQFGGKLVDEKVTYIKNIVEISEVHPNVTEYQKNYTDPKLYELAIDSGVHSRYNLDPFIGRDKFIKLYKAWIDNSLTKQFDNHILVYQENNEILAMITIGGKDGKGSIGISAVDSKLRGKGIGKVLFHSCEHWFIKDNLLTVEVATQAENLAACRLFESCGYSREKTENFYHFWLKR